MLFRDECNSKMCFWFMKIVLFPFHTLLRTINLINIVYHNNFNCLLFIKFIIICIAYVSFANEKTHLIYLIESDWSIDNVDTWAQNENTSTIMSHSNKTMIITKFKYDSDCCTFDIFCCTVVLIRKSDAQTDVSCIQVWFYLTWVYIVLF